MSLLPVHLAGTGSFLPGPPVPNVRVEAILGPLNDAPPKVRSFVDNLGKRMLDRGGVKTRHFAVDPETGDMTHTFSSMAEIAARRALLGDASAMVLLLISREGDRGSFRLARAAE